MHKGSIDLDMSFESDTDEPIYSHDILTMPQTHIQDVWASNFDEEIKKLMKLTEKYNIIAMDTQFPGMIATRCQVDQRYFSQEDCEYFLVRRNVQETKMIQIGLTIADEEGNVPHPVCTWQFNFKFDREKDRIVDQSYDLLIKAGVRFDQLVVEGIDYSLFAQYFAGSGLILNKKVKWVVFHGSSDFAYLLRLVLGEQLPQTIEQFYKTMKTYFPNIYDLKYIIKDIPGLKDVGLAKLSYEIGCSRIGPQHQAGSDSLLTLCCYFKMLEKTDLFSQVQFTSCLNIIFGIGVGFIKTSVSGFNNQRQYQQTNSYMSQQYNYNRDYSRDYYDNRSNHNVYMSQMHHNYMNPMGNTYGNGPLYNYLHQQQPGLYHNYMYQNGHDNSKRY